MNSYAGPVTVQFQTDGSNYNATTRNIQDFFGFRAYYFTGSDATNLQATNSLITGRIDALLSRQLNENLNKITGQTHTISFVCPVRNYTVATCSRELPCDPPCIASDALTCCGGFCVPVDDYGDPFPTTHEIVMVKPELVYPMNSAVNPEWTSFDSRIMQRLPGSFTSHHFFSNHFANASLEVNLSSPLFMFHKASLKDPLWLQNMTKALCDVLGMCEQDGLHASLERFSAYMENIVSTNITVRRCKFTVVSVRAGIMTASMRFEYKEPKRFPYDASLAPIYDMSWIMQPLAVDPRRCVTIGSSLTSVAAGSFSTFTVYSRDMYSNPRILGGEVVNALLISQEYSTPKQLAADVVNNGNGTYFVEYLLTKTGKYFLAINIIPLGQVAPAKVNDILSSAFSLQGFPVSVTVESGPINLQNVSILGNMQSGVASYFLMHIVRIYDVYGNLASPSVAAKLSVAIPHSSNFIPYLLPRTQSRFAAADIIALDLPGDFMLTWIPVMTGWHVMNTYLNRSNINVHIGNSPFALFVLPAPIDPSSSEASGPLFDLPVLTVSEKLFGTIVLRDSLGNIPKGANIIQTSRYQVSFSGIEISDCPYIQNSTLLETLKACPDLFRGNMSTSKRCTSSSYLASNTRPSLIQAYTLNGQADHTVDHHDKLLAWLANTIRFNTCNQIARIAFDTISRLPRSVPSERWIALPSRDSIPSLVNTSRIIVTTAEIDSNGNRFFALNAACTAAGLYRVAVSVSRELLYGLPHLLLVQAGSPEASSSHVYGTLLNLDYKLQPMHSEYVSATELYHIFVILRDKFGNFVWTGRPDTSVSVGDIVGFRCSSATKCFPASRSSELRIILTNFFLKVTDSNDGAYSVSVIMPTPGQFDVNIFLTVGESRTLIGQSPYTINVVSGSYTLQNTLIEGQGVMSCGAGVICSFSIINRDKFKNVIVLPNEVTTLYHTCTQSQCNITNSAIDAYIELYSMDGKTPVPVSLFLAGFKAYSESGKVSASYAIRQAGTYSWNILVGGSPAPGSPFQFSIFGGITSPLTTVVEGYGLQCAHPGFPSTFVIRTRDSFSNYKTAGGDIVEVVQTCSVPTQAVDWLIFCNRLEFRERF
jgi:hypothetical protein